MDNKRDDIDRITIDCVDCVRRQFCMEIIVKLDDVLRELGIMDYCLKIFICANFNKEGVETEHKRKVEERIKSLDETINTQ